MASEPIKLPTYAGEVRLNRWYCFHCNQHRTDAYTIHVHMSASHDLDAPVNGTDYGDGEMVAALQLQRTLWEREAPIHFARALNSLAGADDFAYEVGAGMPDA